MRSAPYMMAANTNAVLRLSDGSPALGDSLKSERNFVPGQLQAAYEKSGFSAAALEDPPKAMGLRVGGERVTWHSVPLNDLPNLTGSNTADAHVVCMALAITDFKM